ncbi:MAG: putative metalloprotease CJM1_0395 family protein, partial [Desulfobulbaceae bacterium]|nr:putative metalloprotease CJM1_0395 family protein [Desulfobulbaceae bacterium]
GGASSTGRVPTAPQGSEQAPPRTGLGGDSFAQGQWWKNRSQAATSDEAAGDWRAQAAVRAYGAQAGNGVGMPADVTDAAGAGAAAGEGAAGEAAEGAAEEGVAEGEGPAAEQTATGKDQALTPEEQRVVTQLQVRDVQVRAHEQAHLAAAGGYAASGASFQYQRGPDGRKYAVGGEVQIDVSGESDPEKTIRKMNVVRSAALAPADPSAQDRRVAARAAAGIVDAQGELYKLREEEAAVKREEAAQRREASGQEAAGGAAGASADTTGSVSGGIRLSVRGYGDSGGSMGGDNAAGQGRRGFNRIV